MTESGYKDILARIQSMPVFVPPEKDLTVDQLWLWLEGYRECLDNVVTLIKTLSVGQRDV